MIPKDEITSLDHLTRYVPTVQLLVRTLDYLDVPFEARING